MSDIWGDDNESPTAHRQELDREWQSRHAEFYNVGYREGLEEGKHDTAQEGFDAGYYQGCRIGFEWGTIRGAVSTVIAAGGKGDTAAGPVTTTSTEVLATLNKIKPNAVISQALASSGHPDIAPSSQSAEVRQATDTAKAHLTELGFKLAYTQQTTT